jgi:hypothetical protein
MNCPHCGSPAVQPTGFCGGCGRSVNAPAGSARPADDPTALHYPPPVDPFAAEAPLTGPDPLTPYGSPAEPYTPPPEPYSPPAEPYTPSSATPYSAAPPPYGSQPYPPLAYPGQPPYPYAAPQSSGQGFSITAFVFAAIAVFFVPIVFGLAAIAFAAVARRRGEQHAALAMKLAGAGMLLGIFFGYLVRAYF